jgi:hypothetical protein
MHKDELIQLHTLLCQLKNHFEGQSATVGLFREYADFGVSPQHIHKSKMQHKRAVFLLGKELAQLVGAMGINGQNRVMQRLGALAERTQLQALRKHELEATEVASVRGGNLRAAEEIAQIH